MAVGFVKRYLQVVDEFGWQSPPYPSRAISLWRDLVADCERGYDFGLVEYQHDLRIRDLLQCVLDDPTIAETPEREWFSAEVEEIDRRFRALLSEEPVTSSAGEPWWRKRVPARAGEEFCADAEDRYGIILECVE
ncbi:hypothetical protein ACFLIM_24640 [Nonomuraea sp. M3C6]|uniref:CdiI immunity protein domain-containing protein n=1 Tax=Nonomuraea marmarensis TaxID=3351344 RepID=A0ABW7AJR3_9ACTN